MAAGWSGMNDLIIIQTTQGLVKYVESTISDCKSRGVIIGFDARSCELGYSSKRFAELAAAVFLHSGWKVYMFSEFVPTPFVPFGIHYLNCACGIVVTASHNPKEDNGYKLYWENGCQIIPPIDEAIETSILKDSNQKVWEGLDLSSKNIWHSCVTHNGGVNPPNVFDEYFRRTQSYMFRGPEKNKETKTKFVYSAMHGVGAKFVERALKAFGFTLEGKYFPTASQHLPDPEFPTSKKPNPEEDGTLITAKEVAKKCGAKAILANDPDADRLQVAELQEDGEWKKLNGDQIAILFVDWLFQHYKNHPALGGDLKNLVVVNSTVSSKALKGYADEEGFSYFETLTGFKWIGNKAVEQTGLGKTFMLGYEVEIGFVVGDMSYDKDGVRAIPIFYELLDETYRQGMTLMQRLDKIYQRIKYYKMITKYFYARTPFKMNIVYEKLREGGYPKECGGHIVKSVRDLTKGFDDSKPGNKPDLHVDPDAQMITFTFEDNSVCTLRNSGTEPKVKWYVECKGDTEEDAEKNAKELAACVIKHFIKPDEYGLEYPEGWTL